MHVESHTIYSLLWGSEHLKKLDGELEWGKYGIRFVSQLFEAGLLKSFEQICRKFNTPKHYFF